jgi:hypothetical protein
MILAHKSKVWDKYWYLWEKYCPTSKLLQSHRTCVPGDKWWWDSSVTCNKSCFSTKFCKFNDVIIFKWRVRTGTFSVMEVQKHTTSDCNKQVSPPVDRYEDVVFLEDWNFLGPLFHSFKCSPVMLIACFSLHQLTKEARGHKVCTRYLHNQSWRSRSTLF